MSRSNLAVFLLAAMAFAGGRPPRPEPRSTGPWTSASSPARRRNIDGFAVAGKGTAAAKPNRLEIELEVSAASELTADAIVKYRDAKKRLARRLLRR